MFIFLRLCLTATRVAYQGLLGR